MERVEETRVGAAVLLLIGAAIAAVLALQGRHLVPGITIHVEMERIGALQEGDAIRIAGLELGSIDRIRLEHDHAILDCWIRKRHARLLRETSEFFVNQPGVIGAPYLEVGQRADVPPGAQLEDGATVQGVPPPRLDRLLATGYENLRSFMDLLHNGFPEWNELRAQLDALERTLDTVQLQPGDAARAWLAARRAVSEARALADSAAQTGVDPGRARATLDRATRFAADARAQLAPLARKLDALAAAAEVLARATRDPRLAGFARSIDEARTLATRLDHAVTAARSILAWVDSGRGTLGAFLHDEALADEMKEMGKILKRRPWEALGHPQDRRQAAP